MLAASTPIIKPRRAVNQRFTTVAANTVEITPAPRPTISPQVSISCQGRLINVDSISASANSASAASTGRLMPKRCIAAPANGPIKPNRTRLKAIAEEMVERSQPKAFSRGTISTPGVARTPATHISTRNATAATIQP